MNDQNSNNEAQNSSGSGDESPRPAPAEGLVTCPTCGGRGAPQGIACGSGGCQVRSLVCFTCKGEKRITQARLAFLNEAGIIRQDRIARRLSIREEGKRLNVDFAEWSRIEAGRFPETEAGRNALAARRQELSQQTSAVKAGTTT